MKEQIGGSLLEAVTSLRVEHGGKERDTGPFSRKRLPGALSSHTATPVSDCSQPSLPPPPALPAAVSHSPSQTHSSSISLTPLTFSASSWPCMDSTLSHSTQATWFDHLLRTTFSLPPSLLLLSSDPQIQPRFSWTPQAGKS